MQNIVWAIVWFAVLGFGLGMLLAVAAKIFHIKTDPRIGEIEEILPGANCGGCGFSGCAALAQAIVEGRARIGACPAGGEAVAKKAADVMGITFEETVHYRAQVMCSGTHELARRKYDYMGIADCIAANKLSGGEKACPNGCLGLGSCAKHCKFGAIHVINGVAAVDYDKCRACGVCADTCPKKIIRLIPYDSRHWVGCMSADRGAVTRKYCDVGCLGCRICEKKCPTGAIKVTNFVAEIDYDKCNACGECEKACPRRIIWSGYSQNIEGIVREKDKISDIPDELVE